MSRKKIRPDDAARIQALGAHIRARREELGRTQAQLGHRLGYYQERISAIERGTYGLPSLPAFAALAAALEVGLGDLIESAGYSLTRPRAGEPGGARDVSGQSS